MACQATCVTLLLLFIKISNPTKVWISNVNANNGLNWNKVPQFCDSLTFLSGPDVVVGWDINDITVSEVNLPETGVISFESNSRLIFENKETCKGRIESIFVRSDVKAWLDPYNWNQTSWLPHLQRIPCSGETIIFPSNKYFSVELPNITLPLDKIVFDGQEFDGRKWSEFLKTEHGREHFKGSDQLRTTWRLKESCSDCHCLDGAYTLMTGNYDIIKSKELTDIICNYARQRCYDVDPIKCFAPITPQDHCCAICGVTIKLDDANSHIKVNVADLIKLVKEELQREESNNQLDVHISRTLSAQVQIVIRDNASNSLSLDFGKKLFRKMQESSQYFPSVDISMQYSSEILSQRWYKEPPSVFALMFVVIAISFLGIFYVFIVQQKNSFRSLIKGGESFIFARFENTIQEANSEERLEICSEVLPKDSEQKDNAFENPMYSGEPGPSGEDFDYPEKLVKEENINQLTDSSDGFILNELETKKTSKESKIDQYALLNDDNEIEDLD